MARNKKIRELIKNRIQDISSNCPVTSCQLWLQVKDLMSAEVATVEGEHTVAFAATRMADDGISSLLVVNNKTVTGIITEKDFLEKVVAKGKSAVEVNVRDVMSSPVVSVSPDMTVLEAGRIAEERHVKRLPVIDELGALVGIVTQTDLIHVLMSYGMWDEVAEIMTTDVATIQSRATVTEAAAIMASRGISGIVVMRDDKVAGVLTERDLLKRVIAAGRDPAAVKIEEVMTSPVVSVPQYYSIFCASRIMEKKNVRRLVVQDGLCLRGVVTQTDIFRTIEDRWRDEEEKNLKSLDESDTCVYTLDLDCKTAYVNPAFMRLLEVEDASELISKPVLPQQFWFNPRERTLFVEEIKKGPVHINDVTLKTATGRHIDVTVYSSLTKNVHGRVSGIQGVVKDISVQKELVALREAQKALAASEERYRNITEAVTDYIYTVYFEKGQPVKTIHRPTSVSVTGYLPDELDANPKLWLDVVHPDDLEIVREQVSCCISGRDIHPVEHRIIRKDGNIRWVRRTLVPQFDAEGKILSYDGLLQDITELKIAEQVEIQLLSELEQATEELKDFAYVASHDLKTPPEGIKLPVGWTIGDYNDNLSKNGNDLLNLLLARIKRMYNLIEGVLQYSQTSRREKKTDVDLNELLAELIEADDVPKNIKVSAKQTMPVVYANPGSLKQVLQNLLTNAIGFMDKPDGRIEIGCVEEDGFWKFAIADNGSGMEQKYFDRIFSVFQSGAICGDCHSSGVGLMIAKKIVELAGGKMWFESSPGQGCTFFFTLPVSQKEAAPAETLAPVGANS